MINDSISEIHKKISDEILNNESIKDDIFYEKINEYIKGESFLEKLSFIIENKEFSADKVYDILSLLIELYGNRDKDFWLDYFYNYLLCKTYPNALTRELKDKYKTPTLIFISTFKVLTDYERSSESNIPKGRYPFELIPDSNIKKLNITPEYKRFKRIFEYDYIYELMKLHQELTGYTTLNHVTGVHFVAMHISKQLYELNLPVDLGKVSAAAICHDIGKFGCKGEELKRVPYLHYFYTEKWFVENDMEYIGHVATNHSTWDLELENLPVESLILIYSDFRVKGRKFNGKRQMHIYSLEESFNIILGKLDNVDEKKEKRYKRVYAKLKDFEDYMMNLGVSVNNDILGPLTTIKKYPSLMKDEEVIENLKYRAIEHNIFIMDKLDSESSLSSILEMARSENDWKKLRGYLNVFEEYSTYFTQRQKEITLDFLYYLLIHREEDIRKQSAELMGLLIANYDEEYRKEIPQDQVVENNHKNSCDLLQVYIRSILSPDHKILDVHKRWIGLSLKNILYSLFSSSNKSQIKEYKKVVVDYYDNDDLENTYKNFYLLQIIEYIPFEFDDKKNSDMILDFIVHFLEDKNDVYRLTSYNRLYFILDKIDDYRWIKKVKSILKANLNYSKLPSENFLKLNIAEKLDMDNEIIDQLKSYYTLDLSKTADIFLNNLKTATHWIIKKNNIELLSEHILKNNDKNIIHTAMHFTNLLKVSENESVRNHAGEALLKIFPILSLDKRNDVTVELLRALDIQGYHFTKYIPKYLGQLMLYLRPTELDEIIVDFIEQIKSANRQIKFLVLKTIGIIIQYYSNYDKIFLQDKDSSDKRLVRLLGILLNGLVNYDIQVKQESFRIIGSEIFASKILSQSEKADILKYLSKKLLNLLPFKESEELWFFNNSASLNNIYRFVSDYIFENKYLSIDSNKKLAFFPGTFDPFSLSHKMIAKEIRDLGFEIYLQVDEFSWSKRTQAHEIRREIINMSIAEELDIYLYPEDLPVNLSNPLDLDKLRKSLDNSELYIVVGSDVLLNASSYKNNQNEIHNFPHIIFDRSGVDYSSSNYNKLENALKPMKNDVIKLKLPPLYQNISSSMIREYIDENRDISQLIDPLAQNYIYEIGAYRREPQFKTVVQTQSINIEVIDNIKDNLIYNLSSTVLKNYKQAYDKLKATQKKLNPRIILLKDIENNSIIGFSIFHWIRSSNLFEQFNDTNISNYIRENSLGRIICIDGIFIDNDSKFKNIEQILLTETLSFSLSRDYTYGVFRNIIEDYPSKNLHQVLRLQGFKRIRYKDQAKDIFTVKMTRPCSLYLDLETVLKEEFLDNEKIKDTIIKTRKRLQRVLTTLYPEQLVISFDQNILYEKMIGKICELNNVSTMQKFPRNLGKKMCVPFGSILNGNIVPNTVTKSMHTEKIYDPDISKFNIEAFPYYLNLKNQIKMIKSFNRPVILVDDILNKGYRINAIDPLLKDEDIDVDRLVVGILSSRGKEIMDIQKRQVDAAYFIPNLRIWFNESDLYPFIGGDTVCRDNIKSKNILPSVNFILPYTSPVFIRETKNKCLYELSKVSIYNSLDLMKALEDEYQKKYGRNLTIKHLSEVFLESRYPDKGSDIEYDLNLKASHYLRNDLEQLKRLEDITKR